MPMLQRGQNYLHIEVPAQLQLVPDFFNDEACEANQQREDLDSSEI